MRKAKASRRINVRRAEFPVVTIQVSKRTTVPDGINDPFPPSRSSGTVTTTRNDEHIKAILAAKLAIERAKMADEGFTEETPEVQSIARKALLTRMAEGVAKMRDLGWAKGMMTLKA